MHLTPILVSVAFLFPSALLAAPVGYEAVGISKRAPADLDAWSDEIFARMAIQATINVRPDSVGDFATMAAGTANANVRASYTEGAALATTLLKRADATMNFGKSKIDVLLQSTYHQNLAHDPHHHYTFAFHHSSCGGQCRGHAYRPTGGRIYNAAHAMVIDIAPGA
ncbi:hypothetical protein BKA70DRAFT_1554219 [Coprinopsis sp. MPI-PUGE-AT-0042]|nr:hypothetical protein BKA70DRAFT_1554219 [Coprinopsis sp. MPI-PUGE-AT-0042]